MNKLSKTAKNLDSFFKILFWVLSILGGAILVIASVLLILTEDYPEMIVSTVSLGSVTFDLAADYIPANDVPLIYFLSEVVLTIIALVLVCYSIRIIRKILKPMCEGLPFNSAVSSNLKKLAWVSLIGGGAFSVEGLISEVAVYTMYDFENLFLNDKIVGCSVDYTLDLSFVMMFAIFYLLSYIFKYGEELQMQSDETL